MTKLSSRKSNEAIRYLYPSVDDFPLSYAFLVKFFSHMAPKCREERDLSSILRLKNSSFYCTLHLISQSVNYLILPAFHSHFFYSFLPVFSLHQISTFHLLSIPTPNAIDTHLLNTWFLRKGKESTSLSFYLKQMSALLHSVKNIKCGLINCRNLSFCKCGICS